MFVDQELHRKRWVIAMRPRTLSSAVCPVIMASVMAADAGVFHFAAALAALTGALLIQIGTNFANDYSDGLKGTDANRLGPIRAVASGLIQPQTMKGAIIFTFFLVLVPGTYIVYRGGLVFLLIGVVSILSGILYTAGPKPLGYIGLGDLFVLAFFGPIALGGTYYLHTHELPINVIIAGFAPGLFSVAVLTVNNLRDIDGDREAGKKTLAVRYGPTFAKFEYLIVLVVASLAIPGHIVYHGGDHVYSLAGGLALLVAIPGIVTVFNYKDPRELNTAFAHTGRAFIVFTVLFCIGWLM